MCATIKYNLYNAYIITCAYAPLILSLKVCKVVCTVHCMFLRYVCACICAIDSYVILMNKSLMQYMYVFFNKHSCNVCSVHMYLSLKSVHVMKESGASQFGV